MASVSKRKWTYKGVEKETWIVRYVDKGGAHRGRTFERKKEADAYKRQVETEMETGQHVAQSQSPRIGKLAAEYQMHIGDLYRRGNLAPSTWKDKLTQIRLYIEPEFSEMKVKDLTASEVDAWMRRLRARGLKPKTARTPVSILQHMIDFAMRRGLATRNVAREALQWPENRRYTSDPVRTLSEADVRALILSLHDNAGGKGRGRRDAMLWRCMVYLACFSGLRRGELLGLTWNSVDIPGRLVHINASYCRTSRVSRAPKTKAGVRVVAMPEAAARELAAWREMEIAGGRGDGLAFCTKTGTALRGFANAWYCVLTRAGLGKRPGDDGWIHFHALRHFAISLWLDRGVPIPQVSAVAGHANAQVTMQVYAHAISAPTQVVREIEAAPAGLLPSAREPKLAQGLHIAT